MDESPGYETILRTRSRAEFRESRLVLEAVGIRAQASHQDGWWLLIVPREEGEAAVAELEAYRQEKRDGAREPSPKVPLYGGAAAGVICYVIVITSLSILNFQQAYGWDWFAVGRMQAGRVMSGQWWRTVTALTLHLDVAHLIGNLLFGALFGFLAGRVLGGGVAWLSIITAGALGNLINAMVQAPTHVSIGASTAVFAALGVIVAHALRPRSPVPAKPLKRWSPLIAGAVLFGMTGVGGPRTDVLAHLTGFLAGILIGWVGCRIHPRWLASETTQVAAGLAAIGLVVTAWLLALASSG